MLSVIGLWQSDRERASPSLWLLQHIPAPAPETAPGPTKPQIHEAPAGWGKREQSGKLCGVGGSHREAGRGPERLRGNIPLSVTSLQLLVASGHVGLEA